jgi:phosphate starvation-inducible PhoH-like protein
MAKRARRQVTETASVHTLYPRQETNPQFFEADPQSKYSKNVKPRGENQRALMDAINQNHMVLALGPAGTGKTFLAVAKAVEALNSGEVKRIILARPAVEAGERIGFLPGDMKDKLDPYMRPLYDALLDRMDGKRLSTLLASGVIEIAPLAFMRGRTLNNAFIVVDEAQNCTRGQLKMVMTRLGYGSTMVITGDPDQTDLEEGDSGLFEIAKQVEEAGTDDVAVVRLTTVDVVRHPIVSALLAFL